MKYNTINGLIIGISYKCTSIYGNPSYYIKFEDLTNGGYITGYTASDAACGYSCKNFEGKTAEIKYHITRKGSFIIDFINKCK